MPDISMCTTTTCPSFHKCYRAQATPSARQSFMDFGVPKNRQKCACYIPLRSRRA